MNCFESNWIKIIDRIKLNERHGKKMNKRKNETLATHTVHVSLYEKFSCYLLCFFSALNIYIYIYIYIFIWQYIRSSPKGWAL